MHHTLKNTKMGNSILILSSFLDKSIIMKRENVSSLWTMIYADIFNKGTVKTVFRF